VVLKTGDSVLSQTQIDVYLSVGFANCHQFNRRIYFVKCSNCKQQNYESHLQQTTGKSKEGEIKDATSQDECDERDDEKRSNMKVEKHDLESQTRRH